MKGLCYVFLFRSRVYLMLYDELIGYMYTDIPSLLDFPPTPRGHHRAPSRASCALRVIVDTGQSQSPASPSPPRTVFTGPLSTSASLLLPCKEVHLYRFSRFPHTCVNIRHLFFSFWFTSLCMTDSRTTCVSIEWPYFALFSGWVISVVYMYHIFFIHSSVIGHLVCFT